MENNVALRAQRSFPFYGLISYGIEQFAVRAYGRCFIYYDKYYLRDFRRCVANAHEEKLAGEIPLLRLELLLAFLPVRFPTNFRIGS